MAPSQFGMFTKSDPALATPDLEYHIQPLSTDRLGDPLHRFSAITVSVCNLRPESVGTCHVTAPDHRLHPEIRPNYLAAARDRLVAVKSVRQARMVMTAKALQRYAPEEFLPGPRRPVRCGAAPEGRRHRDHHISPCRHLRHGPPPQFGRGGGSPRAWIEPFAGRGRIRHAADHLGKYRVSGRDDRGKGGRHDPGWPRCVSRDSRACCSEGIAGKTFSPSGFPLILPWRWRNPNRRTVGAEAVA